MKNKKIWVAAYVAGAAILLVAILYALTIIGKEGTERTSGIKTKFDELEFVVVHRPHLTYFVDIKYLTCFATRKPQYQDLVEFQCPDRLLQEAMGGILKEEPEKEVRKKK